MVSLLPTSLSLNSLAGWLVSGMIFTGVFYATQAAVGTEVYNALKKEA